MTFQEALREAGAEILDKIAMRSLSNYFVQGSVNSKAIEGKVTSRTGRLALAVNEIGANPDIKFTSNGAAFTAAIDRGKVPYATLIHEGGVRAVTQKMRRFFWAKWYETKDPMWGALRYKSSITYRPRPFLGNAVYSLVNEIPEILRKHSLEYLRFEITRIITGAQKAANLKTG